MPDTMPLPLFALTQSLITVPDSDPPNANPAVNDANKIELEVIPFASHSWKLLRTPFWELNPTVATAEFPALKPLSKDLQPTKLLSWQDVRTNQLALL